MKIAINIFAVINLLLALVSLAVVVLFLLGGVTGAVGSELTPQEYGETAAAFILILTPFVLACIIYGMAGVGLLMRRRWGFYFHIGGGVLALSTLVGIVYTVPALVLGFTSGFREPFFKSG